MRPVVWSKLAAKNAAAIRRYIENFNPEAAKSTAKRILESVRTVAEHPHIGRAGRDSRTREFPVPGTPYLLVYFVQDFTVEIVAVLHCAQIIK